MNECPRCGQAGMGGHTHVCMTAAAPAPARYQTCPKCDGQGHVAKPPWVPGDIDTWYSTTIGSYQCPVCRGLKIIAVPEGG